MWIWLAVSLVASGASVSPPGAVQVRESRPVLGGLPLATPAARTLMAGETQLRTTVFASVPSSLDPTPVRITADQALAVLGGLSLPAAGATVELVAWPRGDVARPVYRIDPRPQPTTLWHPLVYVDALDGRVWTGPDRTLHAQARAFARNPVLDPVAEEFELAFIDEASATLSGPYYHVVNCEAPMAGSSCVQAEVAPSEGVDFLFDAPDISVPADNRQPEDPFAAASVYYHADKFQSFALGQGLAGLPCHEQDTPATLLANYRVFTEEGTIFVGNASYVGDCSITAVFGQGPDADWGYDGDVVYHELTHGLIAAQMGPDRFLGFAHRRSEGVLVDAGSIGEGLSDFVSNVISGDPLHGDYAAQVGGGQGRSADNTLRCPEAISGQIHFDGQMLAGALWEAHAQLGDAMVGPIIRAVAMFPEDVTFEAASELFIEVVDAELGADAAAVLADALQEHGLVDCERVVPIDALDHELWLIPSGPQGRYEPIRPPPVQLRLDVPEDSSHVRVEFAIEVIPTPGWDPVGDVHVLLKTGEPIVFTFTKDEEDANIVDADSDLHIPNINDGVFEADVTPGASVYAAVFNRGIHVALVSDFVVTWSGEVDPGTGTGSGSSGGGDTSSSAADGSSSGAPGQDDAGNDGCGCRTGDGGAGWSGILVLGLFGFCRRRDWSSEKSRRSFDPEIDAAAVSNHALGPGYTARR